MIERHDERSETQRGVLGWNIPNMEVPLLQKVFDRWLSLCNGSDLPLARSLDALDFMAFTSNMMLADVLPDGDVEFRIVGEEVVAVRGAAMKGMRLSDFRKKIGDNPSLVQFHEAIKKCEPKYYDGPAYNFDKTYLRARRLILPFMSDEGSCQKLLIVVEYSRERLS